MIQDTGHVRQETLGKRQVQLVKNVKGEKFFLKKWVIFEWHEFFP